MTEKRLTGVAKLTKLSACQTRTRACAAEGDVSKLNRYGHIRLTSHPERSSGAVKRPILWGAADPKTRGPVVGAVTRPSDRNVVGAHGGPYSVYRALAISAGALNPLARPDFSLTTPAVPIGPFPQWSDPARIVSLDPWGHLATEIFADEIATGLDVRPTIAVTRARLKVPELLQGGGSGRLRADGRVVSESGEISVVKAAIDPVWNLGGVARRFDVEEKDLRRTLFEQTGGMFPELVTRPDISVFLPPIGGATLYLFGDIERMHEPGRPLTCRVHDECNGSDVFGSDICTCRPYLVHGIEECVKQAQNGGTGVILYNRKEGRALGEVTKFLVYNARKRQEGGDTAATYFERTECVAGVQDARFQQLMPDPLHWLGVTRIDRFVSMSNLKYDALVQSGVAIGERVALPDDLIPPDAAVEIEAKKAAGYFSPGGPPSATDLAATSGRSLEST